MGRAAIVCLVVMIPCWAHGQSAESCRSFVREFYKWYTQDDGKWGYDDALKRRRGSFSAELVRRLQEDRAAQARTPGEITGLDFDPFINAQDLAQEYRVGKVTRRGKSYLAQVFGIWNGKKSVKPDVTPELVFTRGRWVFVNFHYEALPKEQSNLLRVLELYRKDRAKPKKSD